MPMNPDVLRAISIDRSSSARQRTVDITTTGARTGRQRRIEIWFYRAHGRWFLSSTPAKRDWYANLTANPRFVFHVKHGAHADVHATAEPVPDEADRRHVFESIVEDLNQPSNPGAVDQPQHVGDWLAGSPLLEIHFDDLNDAPGEVRNPGQRSTD